MMTVSEMVRMAGTITDEDRQAIMKEMFEESPVKEGVRIASISAKEQEADSYDEEWEPDFDNAEDEDELEKAA
jgi:hypothetical protein